MKVPTFPANEAERLAALNDYDVLDTECEASFDALTRLAAHILEVPIALVSLIDADRQWFKSRYGTSAEHTPRDVSFCAHVVADGEPLIVTDAHEDSRFADNPLTTADPSVRFYVGMPLRTVDGFVLGTLCAIDHVPRAPTSQQLDMLALLANQVVDQLEARRKRRQLTNERAAAVENARRLSVLFDAMAEGVVVQNDTGAITSANSSAGRILGLTVDQIAGRTSTDPRWRSIHEDGTPFPGETHPAIVTLRSGKASTNVVMGVHKPEGDITWVSINSLPLQQDDADKPHATITTFHDITAAKAARDAADRLARQQHLVTTGTLAAGVGHEINNPLTFILANIDFALEELHAISGSSPTGRLLELVSVLAEARAGAERVRKIVRGLRAVAGQDSEPIPTPIDGAIDISINMTAHETRHKATVIKELLPTPAVLADESRLTQVLVNLIANAAQAFTTGDVETNRIVVSSALAPDGRVEITVGDNGPGIAADLQQRIFDPFFSTKPVGQGTGLGLSISLGIVKGLNGELSVQSGVGTGTRFRMLLPAATRSSSTMTAERTSESFSPRGRVLVVDDELAILQTIRRVLDKDHEVVTLVDSREALKRIEGGESFDVIFCDLMMPYLRGDALYESVKAFAPASAERFVFVTGGVTEVGLQRFLAAVPNERLDKPFEVQSLRGIVRRYVAARSR